MAKTVITPGEENLPVQRGDFSLAFSNIHAGIEGDFGAESSRVPFLSIAQKSSDIIDTRPETLGNFIYAGRLVVPKPAQLSVFGARQYYKQNLTFERGSTVKPKLFSTKEEVLSAGGNLERFRKAGSDDDNYVPEMVAKIVLFSPAKGKDAWGAKDDVMSYPAENGTLAVPMLWTLRGVAYGQIVPNLRMIDRAMREEGKEIACVRFTLSIVKMTFQNSTFVPVLDRLPEDNSADVVKVLHQIFEA